MTTWQDLNGLRWIDQEIQDLQMEEKRTRSEAESVQIGNQQISRRKVGGKSNVETAVEKIETVRRHLLLAIAERAKKKKEALQYIDSVEDSLTRRILTLRFVSGLTWREVSQKIGGGNTEQSVWARAYRQVHKDIANGRKC